MRITNLDGQLAASDGATIQCFEDQGFSLSSLTMWIKTINGRVIGMTLS
jgi:hypothetical protein